MCEYYVVKSGDTLWGISKKYKISVQNLAKINSLFGQKVHQLKIGQKIYLKDNSTEDNYDLYLKIILLDLTFKPINNATLKLEYDGKTTTEKVTEGCLERIKIYDHTKGLKVYFKNLKGEFDLIAHHQTLPIGKKTLKLTSRKMKVEGKHYSQEGIILETISDIVRVLKVIGKPILEGEKTQPIQRSAEKGKIPNIPSARNEQKRTDAGNSTHILAVQFTEDNFLLSPENNKYRAYIINTAKRHDFTPHALAALINAEAAKNKNGEWNTNSQANSSTAAGLTQFLSGTWLEICKNQSSLVGQHISRYPDLTEQQKLKLRFNAEMSIDAAAVYALQNFKESKLPYQNLKEPSAIAKLAYLLHHEGASGGRQFIQNTIEPARARKLLFTQFGKNGKSQATAYLERYNNNAREAYRAWLSAYIDGKIRVEHYVATGAEKDKYKNVLMQDVIAQLTGTALVSPTAKTPQKQESTTAPKGNTSPKSQISTQNSVAGGSNTWKNPLETCKLRTAGLANARSATFGKVRNNNTRNHQGIDLQATPAIPIYAVCSGVVVAAKDTGGDYGQVIILKVSIHDLPSTQKEYAKKHIGNGEFVYFFYAHLSTMTVQVKNPVNTGDIIGETGSTGNAQKMTTIAKGAHLHFEARKKDVLGKGLDNRFDPIPFLTVELPY